jgi:TRAP-type C4-dicarboxylate transport system substrate-binding protein
MSDIAAFARGAAVAAILLAAGAASAQTVIKIGAPTVRDANEVWMNTFKAEVEQATGPRYRVETYPGGLLGSMPRSLDGILLGTIEATITIPEFMGGLDKRFGVISMPGVFDDPMHAYRTAQDPEFIASYWTLAEGKGVKFAGMHCPTDTNYVFRTPIASIDDFKGKKVRTFPSPIEFATLAVLGATPAPMSLDEVLPALQTGVIDASKSGMTVFTTFKYQAAARHAIRTNETMICVPAVVSKSWFDKQPADAQRAVLAAGKIADQKAQAFATGFNDKSYVDWVAGGGVLITLTPAQRADFMRRLAVVEQTALKDEPQMRAMFQIVKRVAQRTKR